MDKENDFPILEALKKYKTHFNTEQFISLPPDSAYGNLNLSWMEIVIRLECVNELIINIYKDFFSMKARSEVFRGFTLDEGHKQQFYIEQLFYWLKKTTDQLISLMSIMADLSIKKRYQKKIKVSSIGEFLKKEDYFNGEFDLFKKILNIINEVANCYKHSFINSQLTAHRGSEYPVVFAYMLHFNDLSNKPGFYTFDLRVILKEYNEFLKTVKNYIKSNFEVKS